MIVAPANSSFSQETQPNSSKYEDIKEYLPRFLQDLMDRPDQTGVNAVLDILVPHCLDAGVNQDRCMNEEMAKGTFIPNRAALLTYMEEHFLEAPGEHSFSLRLIDIKDFRSADKVDSMNGDKSADLIINRVAEIVMDKLKTVNNTLKDRDIEDSRVVAARYGGDEIALLFDNIDDEMRDGIYSFITNEEDGICSIEGHYLVDGKVLKRKVQLKETETFIEPPKDKELQKIFWTHIERGVLLNNTEIEEISKLLGELNIEEEEDPKNLTVAVEHLEQMIEQHPEFEEVFTLVASLPVEDDKEQTKLLVDLDHFIHRNLNDRLLGEHVLNMSDFAKHMLSKPFKKVYTVDVKLKEINDYLSIAHGDLAIRDAWKQIEIVIHQNMRDLYVYRRGGTFVICETHDKPLDEEITDKLLDISHIQLPGKEKPLSFTVGTGSYEIIHAPHSRSEVKFILNNIFSECDKGWYKNLLIDNLDHPEYFERPDTGEEIKSKDISDPKNYIPLVLYGKRSQERITVMLNAMDELTKEIQNEDIVHKIHRIRETIIYT